MDLTEEPKVQVAVSSATSSEPVVEKKKIGRPRTRPERVERHEATPARLAALVKVRAMKAQKVKERKERGVPPQYQEMVQPAAQPNQGYNYSGNYDVDAAASQSDVTYEGVSQPEVSDVNGIQTSTKPGVDSSVQEGYMNRMETLLNRLDEINSNVPSGKSQRPEPIAEEVSDHSSLYNSRYSRSKPQEKPLSRWMRR